jgi:hypothetical protein
MKFRNLSTTNDWSFGQGMQSYASDLKALCLNLKTRILSWAGDCFFDLSAGIDWKNLLDYNTQKQIINALKNIAFKTEGVIRVNSIVVSPITDRSVDINISVDTIYGSSVTNAINLSVPPV